MHLYDISTITILLEVMKSRLLLFFDNNIPTSFILKKNCRFHYQPACVYIIKVKLRQQIIDVSIYNLNLIIMLHNDVIVKEKKLDYCLNTQFE